MATPKTIFLSGLLATTVGGLVVSRTTDLSTQFAISSAFSVSFLVWVFYTSWLYPFYLSPLRHIPTPPGPPFFGQFFPLVTQEIGIPLRKWHAEHGGIIRFILPFGIEGISVVDDAALKRVLTSNVHNYPKPLRLKEWMKSVLGDSILFAEGPDHSRQKKSMSAGFSLSSAKGAVSVFWEKSLLLTQLWKDELIVENAKGKTFEIIEWISRLTMDITGVRGLGTEFDTLHNPNAPILEAYRLILAFDRVSSTLQDLTSFFPIIGKLPTKMNREMQRAHDIITTTTSEVIHRKTKEAQDATLLEKGDDIISLMVQHNLKTADKYPVPVEESQAQAMTLLSTYDNTMVAIAWILHLLSKNPHIQTKLRAEIRSYIPSLFDPDTRMNTNLLSETDIDTLPYLDNVCNEGLRFIPPTPMTVRQSIQPDKLGEYDIPAGTEVLIYAYVTNYMSEYWGPNADQFDPDRWDNLPPTYTLNAYQTFLQGGRRCPGRRFAELEIKVILAALLSMHSFELDPAVPDPEQEKVWRIILHPRNGIKLRVRLL